MKIQLGIIILIISVLPVLTFSAEVFNDIPYYPEGEDPNPEKNLLDVYVPEGAVNVPVFFWIHGGGWASGDKDNYIALGHNFADQEGYVTVIISYRLSDSTHPEVMHPDHITDVARAFAWTKENIADYSGDPDRIFISGHSAGGHLTALLFTNTRFLEAESLSPADIFGAMPISGMYNIWFYVEDDSLRPPGLRRAFGEDSTYWTDASPLLHLHDGMPPTRIFFALEESPTFRRDAAALLNGMNDYQPTDTVIVPGSHSTELVDLISHPGSRIRRELVAFIEEVLGTHIEASNAVNTIDRFKIFCYPNPYSTAVTAEFRSFPEGKLHVSENIQVKIYDINGRKVRVLDCPSKHEMRSGKRSNVGALDCPGYPDNQVPGSPVYFWHPSPSLPSGIYFIKATIGNETAVKKVIYLR